MTSTDLKAYLGIIARMKGLSNSPEFEQTFTSLTASLPKSKQFLLRMELKRLAQPCNYFIDLRGHVDGAVKPYQYNDKTHYLDETAQQIFEEGIRDYGSYTLGVYEDVMNADNNYRVRHRKETEEHVKNKLELLRKGTPKVESPDEVTREDSEDAPAKLHKTVQFGLYIPRCEERMNFGIEVEVRHAEHVFIAMTSDISVSGCKLKVTTLNSLANGDILNLILKGLEKEFALNLPEGLNYQVLEIEQHEKFSYIRLRRQNPEKQPQFNQFLQNYINGNKRRYKVNLDNVLDTLVTKGYEQYYLPRIHALPVFISVSSGAVTCRFCLTSDYNKSVWHYFLDEQQNSVINRVLSVARLKHLLNIKHTNRSCMLYCFTHAAKGKLYFYTATSFELATAPELREMFFGFGSGKPSWKIFHLNLLKTQVKHSINESVIPGAMPASPSALVHSMLQDMHYIATLTEVSAADQRIYYNRHQYNLTKLPALNHFGLSKAEKTVPCEAIQSHYVNLRSESRYLYKTTVIIRQKQEGKIWQAFSRDFSAGGMQLECAEQVDFMKGEVLLLELPDLQKITTKFQLTNLPYEVMAVSKNRTIMNLKIAKVPIHTGKQFFSQLIQSNRSKLTLAEETPKYPGLSDALRNMYVKASNNFVFFIHRYGLKHDITVIGRGFQEHSLHKLLRLANSEENKPDFMLLTKNNKLCQDLAATLKQMKQHEAAKPIEYYLKVTKTTDGKFAFSSHFDYEFSSADERKQFIENALAQHTLFSFRFFVSRTGKLDAEYIAREMNYISIYAIHKAKSLEEELLHVEGVVDVVETSEELISRFNLLLSEQQAQARLAVLAQAEP